MPRENNFFNFTAENIERYYREKILEKKPLEQVELENIIFRSMHNKLHFSVKNMVTEATYFDFNEQKIEELCENKLCAQAGLRSFYPVDFRHRLTLSVKCKVSKN